MLSGRTVTLTLNPALDVSTAVDRVEPAHKLRCGPPRFDPGGGGINVARVIGRLGGRVLAVYPAGGVTGQRLTDLLAAEGVETAPVPIAGETRESFTVADRSDGAEYRFVLPGPALTPAEQRLCRDATLQAAPPGAVIVASGSLPPGVPPEVFGDLAHGARAANRRLAVDTSGAPLAAALEAGVWLLKPNLRELSDHLGRPLADDAARLGACRDLIAAGAATLVALSLGAEGALLVTRDEAWSALALAIEPVSTVGAGDSFLGGLLWALDQGLSAAEALRHAVAAGAAALLSPGTDLCAREDVMRLLSRVEPVRLGTPASPA